MGTGKIGQILCRILTGFGVNLICFDVFEADAIKEMGGKYVTKEKIYAQSDILFLMSKY
jgi:D-lactate dehydrogenase